MRIPQAVPAMLLALLLAAAMTGCKTTVTRTSSSSGTEPQPAAEETSPYAPLDLSQPPEYLYSIPASGETTLTRPIGLCVTDGEVFVADSAEHGILVYDLEGTYARSFGNDVLDVPLFLVSNPADGNLYVADRRSRSIEIFTPAGDHVGTFDPRLPASELPDFETDGAVWAPIAIAFAEDGSMYVTEILNGHRFLIFGPDGAFVRSVGTVGIVDDPSASPGLFQFPNGIETSGGEIWVVDSNNRRIQVFGSDGEFLRMIVTEGLPRGMAIGSGGEAVVADTLAHDVTVWDLRGNKVLTFGERGMLEGQFNYPNDVAIAEDRIFVTDTSNARVQVWGFPAAQ